MNIRTVTLTYGIVFIILGIAGFIPGLRQLYDVTAPPLVISAGSGYLFGLFPINVLHNLVHFLFGVAALSVFRSLAASRSYLRAVAIVYAVFALMGLIPVLNTTFGLVPLFGHDIWLHILLAAGAAYFGFFSKEAGY
jgi:hypothetical protein